VCQYEHQLFDHFFPGADPEGSSLAPLMDPLATILYDALRPQFIHIHALDELCEIVDILTHEVIASSTLVTQCVTTLQNNPKDDNRHKSGSCSVCQSRMDAFDYIHFCLDLPYMHTSLIQVTYALFYEACAELNVQFLSKILEDVSHFKGNTMK